MEKKHQLTIIALPDITFGGVEKLRTKIERFGRIERTTYNGARTLAYLVDGHKRGVYLYYDLWLSPGEKQRELSRVLDEDSNVLRYLLVIDEEVSEDENI